jgi:hypothetical protein
MSIPAFAWPFIAAFWIFALWMLWIVAKSLESVVKSLKEIALSFHSKS